MVLSCMSKKSLNLLWQRFKSEHSVAHTMRSLRVCAAVPQIAFPPSPASPYLLVATSISKHLVELHLLSFSCELLLSPKLLQMVVSSAVIVC